MLSSNFTSQELITWLKSINNLSQKYQLKVRHYTLEQHTLLVMNEFEKHFTQIDLPISRNLFLLVLALHDIGKPQAFLEGNKNNQYKYTIETIKSLKNLLPFNDLETNLCIALIEADPIGGYLQKQISIETAKKQIISLANKTNLSVLAFFKLLVIYYQCDIASYTKDAGGWAYLEHLFAYQNGEKILDATNMRLKFSLSLETRFVELEKSLLL